MPLPSSPQIQSIPIDLINAGPFQARTHFDNESMAELAQSIADSGVIQPIIVRSTAHNNFVLLAGERRWRAASQARLDTIPAIVRDDLDDSAAAILGLIENLQRDTLNILETAQGLQRLYNQHGLTHAEIAAKIGKSRLYVTNHLRILRLEKPVQELLKQQKLSMGHAKVLAAVSAPQQVELAMHCAQYNLSVRQLEHRITQQATEKNHTACLDDTADELKKLEYRLSEHLGNTTQVTYNTQSQKGQLIVSFHGLEEFDGLMAKFNLPDLD